MAHQTDVHVVHQSFQPKNPDEQVVDPVCGMKVKRKDSKHVLFRGEQTIYFCSTTCKEKYLEPTWKQKAG